jgi:methylase of polypeptide subunit release factors
MLTIRSLGEVFVPAAVEEAAGPEGAVRAFEGSDLRKPSRLFDFVARGGTAVLLGPWRELIGVLEYAEKRKRELAGAGSDRKGFGARGKNRRAWEKERERALNRLAACVDGDRLCGETPGRSVPFLLEFLGEPAESNRGLPFLVPIRVVRRLLTCIESPRRIEPLDADLVVPEPVLAPVSPETVTLMKEALEAVIPSLPPSAAVLDMGCGSGSLTFLAALEFHDRVSSVTATDVLPEALAATRLNRDRLVSAERIPPDRIDVTRGGDLFEPVEDRVFDLILFNAPWVTTAPRSRTELATHDGAQEVLGRFLEEAPRHLVSGGSVLLEYSDHSGSGAVDNLKKLARHNGWTVSGEWKRRIQARRKSPKWETIFVFHLTRGK